MWKRILLVLVVGLFAVGSFSGCSKKKETTGDKAKKLIDKTEKEGKKAIDKAAEKAGEAADEVKKKVDE